MPQPLPEVEKVTTKEREQALLCWLRIAQRKSFEREIRTSKRNPERDQGSELQTSVPSNSKLKTLAPRWNDSTKLLVLAGRLDNALLTDAEKHPIILPPDHDIVTFLIRDEHINRTTHGGPQACIALLRQRYWIVNLRRSVRRFIGQTCTVCIRHRRTTMTQFMGQLPAFRVTPAFPIVRVGIDFAGPFTLRTTASTALQLRTAAKYSSTYRDPHTTVKGWIAVFVCLVTWAVYLDVVRGLSVENFLYVLVRFTSRRGMCSEIWSEIWSDNGTKNEIQRVLKEWGDKLPVSEMPNMGITWNFITPAAPHRGGIWEAGVKSMKHHLYRVMGRRVLTADQLCTLVTQIEACMNARPLFAQSDDPLDLNPITPAHLVIGRSTIQLPMVEDVLIANDDRLTIWGLQQKMLQQFWTVWKEDYLSALQTRNKWYKVEENLAPGDMVVITNENSPPSAWPLGKVRSTTTGADGLVREAAIEVPVVRNGQHTTTILDRNNQHPPSTLPVDV